MNNKQITVKDINAIISDGGKIIELQLDQTDNTTVSIKFEFDILNAVMPHLLKVLGEAYKTQKVALKGVAPEEFNQVMAHTIAFYRAAVSSKNEPMLALQDKEGLWIHLNLCQISIPQLSSDILSLQDLEAYKGN